MSRVVVVTGAAGAIGTAICDLLEERGWKAIGMDRQPMAREDSMQVDLADVNALANSLSALSRVDGLVNNAAVQLFKPISQTTFDEWDEVASINVRAAFACMSCLQPRLAEAKGSIVNITSVHSRASSPKIAAYAASKGALSALTRAAAVELAPSGIRVNAVVPGAVDTPALRTGFTRRPDAERELLRRTPLGRVAAPRDVAQAVFFLLDPEQSGFITGQEITVDGGALAHLSTE